MAALSGDRVTARSFPGRRTVPVAASVTIYVGALVVVDSSGYARPGRASTTDKAIGIALQRVTNGATAGAVTVDVDCTQIGYFANLGGDAVTIASVGADCFVEDDQTVRATSNTSTRVRAGKVWSIDSTNGVGVRFDQ